VTTDAKSFNDSATELSCVHTHTLDAVPHGAATCCGLTQRAALPKRQSLIGHMAKFAEFLFGDIEVILYDMHRVAKKVYHPTWNDNFNSSCMIPVIFGTVSTD